MSKQKDPAADAHKVLAQINENLSRQGEQLPLLPSKTSRAARRLAQPEQIIHAQTFDPIRPTFIVGWGFSKRHPEDESDRSVGYEFALKRAIDDTFDQARKAQKSAYYH